MLYGVKDIVTAEVDYEDAKDCRSDVNKCGYNGLYFEPLSNLKFKMFQIKINDIITDLSPSSIVVKVTSIYLLTIVFGYEFFKYFFFPELY
jgi:hypothetical protein